MQVAPMSMCVFKHSQDGPSSYLESISRISFLSSLFGHRHAPARAIEATLNKGASIQYIRTEVGRGSKYGQVSGQTVLGTCGQGGEGVQNPKKFVAVFNGSPLRKVSPTRSDRSLRPLIFDVTCLVGRPISEYNEQMLPPGTIVSE